MLTLKTFQKEWNTKKKIDIYVLLTHWKLIYEEKKKEKQIYTRPVEFWWREDWRNHPDFFLMLVYFILYLNDKFMFKSTLFAFFYNKFF